MCIPLPPQHLVQRDTEPWPTQHCRRCRVGSATQACCQNNSISNIADLGLDRCINEWVEQTTAMIGPTHGLTTTTSKQYAEHLHNAEILCRPQRIIRHLYHLLWSVPNQRLDNKTLKTAAGVTSAPKNNLSRRPDPLTILRLKAALPGNRNYHTSTPICSTNYLKGGKTTAVRTSNH